MSATKAERKSRMKPFVKYVNFNHMLPTRFIAKDDFEFRNLATEDKMNTQEGKKGLLKELKAKFQER
jgi:large subunit ribosomal protein L27e